MTDTFDAVLVEMRAHLESGCACCQSREFLDRLAAAHAAEQSAWFLRAREEAERCGQAESRAEAAERDARRYRWLRERLAAEELTDEDVAIFALRTVGPIALRPADDDDFPSVDAAIDAAIATTEQADE